MRRFLSFALLALILTGCGSSDNEDGGNDSSLIDMYDSDNGDEDMDELNGEEEVPFSEGPTEIPDDLVIPE